jgi:hypothetical protein
LEALRQRYFETERALLGLFFFCMGAQIDLRAGAIALEKRAAICIGKVAAGVAIGLGAAPFNRTGCSPIPCDSLTLFDTQGARKDG